MEVVNVLCIIQPLSLLMFVGNLAMVRDYSGRNTFEKNTS